MTTERKMTFVPAVYALPNLGESAALTLPAASSDNIPMYAAALPLTFATWKEEEQLEYLRIAILEHYVRNEGVLPFMGPIVTYLLHRSADEAPLPFTSAGVPRTPSDPTPVPHVTFVPHRWDVTRRAFLNAICSRDENTFH